MPRLIAASRRTRGFTLIELVIVIAVIAILAALLVPTILGQAERARKSRAMGDTSTIAKSVARMRTDSGITDVYFLGTPTNLSASSSVQWQHTPNLITATYPLGLPSCQTQTPGYICFGGPYMTAVPNDPWSSMYEVMVDSSTAFVTVISAGPNQIYGDSDDITFVQ